jgi:hypothetical protein
MDASWFAQIEPFRGSENTADDVLRFLVVAPAMVLALIILRVAYLRFRSPKGSVERDRSGWGLLSYAMFILLTVVNGLQRFGYPLDWTRGILHVVALGAGIAAVVTTVQFNGRDKRAARTEQRRVAAADERSGRDRRQANEHEHPQADDGTPH